MFLMVERACGKGKFKNKNNYNVLCVINAPINVRPAGGGEAGQGGGI